MKILLLGKNGQVGSNIEKYISNFSHDKQITLGSISSDKLDYADESKVRSFLEKLFVRDFIPDVVINSAAYTQVDKAEEDKEKCFAINSRLPKILAEFCAENNALLVHFSSDYVFDGEGDEAFTEEMTARMNPKNSYGFSKLEGDSHIANSCERHLIIRISWVYNHSGKNFPLTMLRLMQEKEQIEVINDQIGYPAYAPDIAEKTIAIIEKIVNHKNPKELYGTYNFGSGENISWYNFACQLKAEYLKRKPNASLANIKEISSEEYYQKFPTAALRPLNSRLNSDKMLEFFFTKGENIEENIADFFDYM